MNLLQIHILTAESKYQELPIYRTQLSGLVYSVGENRFEFPAHKFKKRIFTNGQRISHQFQGQGEFILNS